MPTDPAVRGGEWTGHPPHPSWSNLFQSRCCQLVEILAAELKRGLIYYKLESELPISGKFKAKEELKIFGFLLFVEVLAL
jgi:hypothetical protein